MDDLSKYRKLGQLAKTPKIDCFPFRAGPFIIKMFEDREDLLTQIRLPVNQNKIIHSPNDYLSFY